MTYRPDSRASKTSPSHPSATPSLLRRVTTYPVSIPAASTSRGAFTSCHEALEYLKNFVSRRRPVVCAAAVI